MPVLKLGGGLDLSYEMIDGEAGKPCLVFLHEGLGSIALWKGFPQRLCQATGCSGLVYEREGYGRSSALRRVRSIHYLHDYALAELPQVLERLMPGREYIVIGHSDGGSIALIHAAGNPSGLRGVITEAAHVFVEDLTVQGVRAAKESFNPGLLMALERYHGEKAEQIYMAWADTWLLPGFKHWNIEYLLPSIAVPTLVVQGTEDQYGTEAQVDAIAGAVPGARKLMLENCGHSPHLEQPETLLESIRGFLREL
ncbi:alpha/beta fold hydrolase [Pseudoduganella violacea]|uniref:Pimeloyl-ACP methyl ester carboxylesterase n=1 Tax=Pseudoduganella violacea TaxID=1715466 RepID=A0A7W5B9M2_9BURK|nr:alpha/beta hydrolase [Pseudoduganella violacea]MBB3118765.1 pimeloyl-ACP methyl ester carboxylesterase [Pseudoduganella violacea]